MTGLIMMMCGDDELRLAWWRKKKCVRKCSVCFSRVVVVGVRVMCVVCGCVHSVLCVGVLCVDVMLCVDVVCVVCVCSANTRKKGTCVRVCV